MIRVEQSDIIFVIDEKLIYTDDFVIKFYTVNVEDFFIRKTQADMVETDGKKCIKLDWKELIFIGEGVMNYQAWNNIPDSEFPDSEYNKCVDRTTQYYINSNVIVDPSSDKSIVELVEAIEEDLQDEVTRATDRENEIEEALSEEIARATERENTIDRKFVNYIPMSQKGSNNGVATLGSDGKVPASQLNLTNYIPKSEKGVSNGVATLNSVGLIPEGQLQFPTRGQLNVANINNLEAGVYQVNGKVVAPEILGGEQANGILVAFPYGSKVQMLYVGRAAGAASGEQVEVYSRRYLATPQRWTEWNRIDDKDQYSLTKSGSNIQLTKNGTVIASVVDSNTTYANMSQTEANTGTATTARSISAKVLSTTIQNKINNEKLVVEGTLLNDYEVEFPEGSFDRVYEALEQGKYVQLKLNTGNYFQLNYYAEDVAFFSTSSAEERYLESLYINSDDTGERFYYQIKDYENNYNVRLNGSTLIIPNNTYSNIMSDIDSGLTLSQINLYLDNIYLFKISRRPNKNDSLVFEHNNAEEGWIAQIEITPNNEGYYTDRNIPPHYEKITQGEIIRGTQQAGKIIDAQTFKGATQTLLLQWEESTVDEMTLYATRNGDLVTFDLPLQDVMNILEQARLFAPYLMNYVRIICDDTDVYHLCYMNAFDYVFEYQNTDESIIRQIAVRGEGASFVDFFERTIPLEPYYRKLTSNDLTWNNGWMQGGTGDMSRVEFTRYGKVVYVNGTILNETAGANLSSILTIPAKSDFRPKRTVQWVQLAQQNFVVDGANKVPSYFISIDKNGLFKIEKMNIGGVGTQYQANKNLFISGSYIVD